MVVNDGVVLACPLCGHNYTHHGAVRIFSRPSGEDGPSHEDGAPTDDNPSRRRDAVAIAVEGECGHAWELLVIQHKGQTYLGVRWNVRHEIY